jgi:hypothetical protein
MLPAHMQDTARRYVERGIPGGHFFTAVICNDLLGAFGRADDENAAAMRDWAMWLYNDAPVGCFGSREKMQAWVEAGGLEGMKEKTE